MIRILSLSVLAFWLVMSVLLVRMVYFPDHSRYEEVAPRLVLRNFLEGGAAINTLHLYHKERKLGHASVNTRRLWNAGRNRHRVHLSGVLDKGAVEALDGQVNWRLEVDLENMERWVAAKGQIRVSGNSSVLDFEWQEGEKMPRFTLKQKGVVVADDTTVQPMVAAMMGQQEAAGLPLPEGVAVPPGAEVMSLIKVRAMEGLMMLAGQKRQAYLLELAAMDQWKARVYFTTAGELALVDLPEGYRMVEPVIYGLVPEYDENEDIPVPPMEPEPSPDAQPAPAVPVTEPVTPAVSS